MQLFILLRNNLSILIIFIIGLSLIGNEFLEKKFHPILIIISILVLSIILYYTLYAILNIVSFLYKSLLAMYTSIKRFFIIIKNKPISTLREDFSLENINKIIIKVFNYLFDCPNNDCYFKMMIVLIITPLSYGIFILLYVYYRYIKRFDRYLCFCSYCKKENSYGSEICNQCGRLLPCFYEEIINQKYYKILESHKNNTDDEIKNNYRRLVKKYHPDKISREKISEIAIKEAEDKLKEVNNAYENIKKYRKYINNLD